MLPTHPAVDLAALPCGLVSFDGAGRLLSVNACLQDWLQFPPGELPGPWLADLLAPACRPACDAALAGPLRDRGRLDEARWVFLARDGSELQAQVSAVSTPVATGAGQAGAAVHVAVVTRLAPPPSPGLCVERLPGLVYQYLLRPDGSASFPYASDAIEALFGVTPALARESAEHIAPRVHAADWQPLVDSIQESARTLARWEASFRVTVDEQVRWLEGHSLPEALPDGSVLWHGYLSDITHRKALEASRQGQAVAEQATRARTEFFARVSHELRTPLNAVLGFSQLLADEPGLGLRPHQQRQLDHIQQAGRHLLGLVDEVLDLAQVDSGRLAVQLAPHDLLPLVEDSLGMVGRMAEQAGVGLRCQVAADLRVMADPGRLVQCLVNLLTHGIRHNRAGGQVAMVATPSRRQQEVRIDVRDTGAGFSRTQLDQLFEPFARPGPELGCPGGTGLGLAVSHSLAERLGGRLTVDSEPGQGTCFSLTLPMPGLARAAPVPAGQAPSPGDGTPQPTGPLRRVLYVEDNTVNVMLMRAIFELRPSLRLDTAGTAADGLAMALADPPALLLLDLGLPDLDGTALLARLRGHPALQAIPAVAVSADASTPDMDRALAAGFQAYWTKPLDLRRTLEALDGLMA